MKLRYNFLTNEKEKKFYFFTYHRKSVVISTKLLIYDYDTDECFRHRITICNPDNEYTRYNSKDRILNFCKNLLHYNAINEKPPFHLDK